MSLFAVAYPSGKRVVDVDTAPSCPPSPIITKRPFQRVGRFTANRTWLTPSCAFPVGMVPSTRQYSGTAPAAGTNVVAVTAGRMRFASTAPWSNLPSPAAASSAMLRFTSASAAQSSAVGTFPFARTAGPRKPIVSVATTTPSVRRRRAIHGFLSVPAQSTGFTGSRSIYRPAVRQVNRTWRRFARIPGDSAAHSHTRC